ncbi:MAG TPA: hypothetical protein VLW75_11020, partial [Rhizomicrobium sp.]|nr:hypothetical protein [Rhizomicrobium sp.]
HALVHDVFDFHGFLRAVLRANTKCLDCAVIDIRQERTKRNSLTCRKMAFFRGQYRSIWWGAALSLARQQEGNAT